MQSKIKLIYSINCLFFYFKTGIRIILTDRAMVITDFFLGTITPFIVQILLWTSIYSAGKSLINGFTYQQTIFYYAFAISLGKFNNGYEIISQLSYQIKSGKLEAYIIKPMPYFLQKLALFLGESLIYIIPLFVVYSMYLINIGYPDFFNQLVNLPNIFIIILLSQILCFFMSFFLAIFSFWVIESNIISSFTLIATSLFGGLLLPPKFWPEWLIPIMQYNPFRYMIAAPAELVVNPNSKLFFEIIIASSLYIFLFTLGVLKLWKKGLQKYNGAGG